RTSWLLTPTAQIRPPTTMTATTRRTRSPVRMAMIIRAPAPPAPLIPGRGPSRPRLQIVARVRLVERLVAQREVGHDVLEQRVGERPPVQEGRVHDLDPREAAVAGDHHPLEERAPP